MRALLALLLALAVAMAGCADDETDGSVPAPDAGDGGAVADGGNDTLPADGNETGDANETPPVNETNETAEALAPVEVVNTTFDYASGETGAEGTSETFTVPEGYGVVVLNLTKEEGDGGLPADTDLNVNAALTIVDADGTEVYSGFPDEPVSLEHPAVAGEWTITYEGTGNVQVTVVGVAQGAPAASA